MPQWEQHLLSTGLKKRKRPGCMTASEIMTIFILFRQMQCSGFQDLLLQVRAAFFAALFSKAHQLQPACSTPEVRPRPAFLVYARLSTIGDTCVIHREGVRITA